jgi:Zn-dependent peptidase ImmA (M78 family)/transcriptional regulator with XRE-family HTH domain
MTTIDTLAANLRRLRSARKLTQKGLADKAGLSRAGYVKLETGKSEPRVSTLQDIAKALGVGVQDLLAPAGELRAVRFRSLKRLRSREQILVDASRWLTDFNDIEEIFSGDEAPPTRSLPPRGSWCDDPAGAAEYVRGYFGIGPSEPIRDICGLLEAHGVKVGHQSVASNDFFGLSIAPADGGPAIVVNTWERISVERWIFTAAHELAHLLLHFDDYDVGETEELPEHESQANAFAAAFLMPDRVFEKEWNETYGLPFVDRVLKVKRMFRVSYRTVLYRLASRQPKTNVWIAFQVDHKRRYGRTLLREDEPAALEQDAFRASFPEYRAAGEPEHLSRVDFAGDRLSYLVRKAVESEHISLGRAAEILSYSLDEMRDVAVSWVG